MSMWQSASARPPSQAGRMMSLDVSNDLDDFDPSVDTPIFHFSDLREFFDDALKEDTGLDKMRRAISGVDPKMPTQGEWRVLANLWHGLAVRMEVRVHSMTQDRDNAQQLYSSLNVLVKDQKENMDQMSVMIDKQHDKII